MANIKFSQFTEKTTLGTVDFLVGYTGAENVQISPTNLLSTFVSGSGTAGQVAYFDPSNNLAGENDFFWDYTNNRLGIGTTSPGAKLQIGSATYAPDGNLVNNLLQIKSPSGFAYLTIGNGDTVDSTSYIGGASGFLVFGSVTDAGVQSEHIRMTNTGNVGIGTATPTSKLQVSGTLDATGISQLGSGGANVYLTSSSAGNVGIGTSSPGNKLEVAGGGVRASYFTSIGGRSFKMDNVAFVGGYSDGSGANGANDLGNATNQWKDLYLSGDITSSAGGATFAGNVVVNSSNSTGVNLKVGGESGNGIKTQYIFSGSGQRNWQIGMASHLSQTLSITPSTAGGNTTFTTPILNLDGSDNSSTFAGDIKQGTRIVLQDNGTIQWGGTADYGNLTWDTGYALIYGQSGKGIKLGTNGSSVALTIDTSQNATFAGNVLLGGNDDYIAFNTSGSGSDPKIKMNSDASFTFLNTAGSASLTLDNSGNATFAGSINSGAITALAKGGQFGSTGYYVNSTFKDVADNCGVILGHNDTANGVGAIAGINQLAFLTYGSAWTQALLLDSSQNATFAGKVSVGGGDTSTAQMALKGQQSLLSFIRGTSGDAQFFVSSDSARLYFSHTDTQSTNLILTLNQDESATFAGDVTLSSTAPILYLDNTTSSTGKNWRLSSAANGKMYITQDGVIDAITLSHTSGNATFAGNVDLADSKKIQLGASQDLKLYHDGSHSYIQDSGTGVLKILSSGVTFQNEAGSLNTLVLDSSGNATFAGNVGIGSFPTSKLQLEQSIVPRITMIKTGVLSWYVGNPSQGSSNNFTIGTDSGSNIDILTLDTSANATFANDVTVTGALSKGSGSFKIDHPVKPDTHSLYHSFVESPLTDLIYRGKVKLVEGKASINIDEHFGMTDGTFVALVDDKQVFTTNEDTWDAVKGKVEGNKLNIECKNETFEGYVSWLVIGDRKDKHIMDTDWTDEKGKPILEVEK